MNRALAAFVCYLLIVNTLAAMESEDSFAWGCNDIVDIIDNAGGETDLDNYIKNNNTNTIPLGELREIENVLDRSLPLVVIVKMGSLAHHIFTLPASIDDGAIGKEIHDVAKFLADVAIKSEIKKIELTSFTLRFPVPAHINTVQDVLNIFNNRVIPAANYLITERRSKVSSVFSNQYIPPAIDLTAEGITEPIRANYRFRAYFIDLKGFTLWFSVEKEDGEPHVKLDHERSHYDSGKRRNKTMRRKILMLAGAAMKLGLEQIPQDTEVEVPSTLHDSLRKEVMTAIRKEMIPEANQKITRQLMWQPRGKSAKRK